MTRPSLEFAAFMPRHRDVDDKSRSRSDTLALEHFLPYRLVVLADSVSRALSTVYEQRFGVSIAEWRVIANLGRFGALSAGDLATHSNLDKPKVTRALQRLLKRRLITRANEKSDRRQSRIALTRQGQTLFRNISRLALNWERDLLSTLSPTDRRSFDGLITKLSSSVAGGLPAVEPGLPAGAGAGRHPERRVNASPATSKESSSAPR